MILLHEEQHEVPLAEVSVVLAGGAAADPVGKEGLTAHASELMLRGAAGRSRNDLDERLDELGASLDASVSMDAVAWSGRCLSRHLPALCELLADALGRPDLAKSEHDKLVREELAQLDDALDDDGTLAARWFDRLALAGHPYARPSGGTKASLASLTRDGARAWATRRLGQAGLLVGFAGDVDAGTARSLAAGLAAALPGRAETMPTPGAPIPRHGRRTLIVDKPERTQSQILIGGPAPARSDPDFIPLIVAAAIFGGTFTSRLMTEVRVKRGWSYGASCSVGRGRTGATTRIHLHPSGEQTPKAIALVLRLWREIVDGGVTRAELELVRGWLRGRWAFELDTPGKRLDRRIDALHLGLPNDDLAAFPTRVAEVTRAEVEAAMRRWWHPEDASIVVTATARDLVPRLKRLALGELAIVAYDAD
ncbi:MAG: insulinase family protein [Myxococcales bacterium]|nr:insulinase family protein [Myxococcales bacterium]